MKEPTVNKRARANLVYEIFSVLASRIGAGNLEILINTSRLTEISVIHMENFKEVLKRGILVTVLIALMFSVEQSLAVDYTVGVKAGDWVKYSDLNFTWNGTGNEPKHITDAKQMDWVNIEILGVSSNIVFMRFSVHYKNGTERANDVIYNVKSGLSSLDGDSFPFPIIAAGLKKGDPIAKYHAITINDTVSGVYAGASRSVNFVDIPSSDQPFTIHWDQATGILVELSRILLDQTPSGETVKYVDFYKATETNMWSADVPGFTSVNFMFILAAMIVIVLVIVVRVFMLRKRKRRRRVRIKRTRAQCAVDRTDTIHQFCFILATCAFTLI